MAMQQRCARCRTKLGTPSAGKYCTSCGTYLQTLRQRPPTVDTAFWGDLAIREAATERHMGRLLAAYRHHSSHGIPIPQEVVGEWANMTQSQVSRFETGSPDRQLDRLAYWARLLGVPQHLLWFVMPEGIPAGELSDRAQTGRAQVDEAIAPVLAHTTGRGATLDNDSDLEELKSRIGAAQKVRSSAADSRQSLFLIGGYAGSGKTELGRLLAGLAGWPLLDKDVITRPLVESLLFALDQDPNDRQSEIYRQRVRPVEYRSLLNAVLVQLGVGTSCVVTAPFLEELPDERWLSRLQCSCTARSVDLIPVWVDADSETMYEHLVRRDAARDSWKLNHWDRYEASLNPDLRPALPHLVVDNARHAAISLPAQAGQLSQLFSPA